MTKFQLAEFFSGPGVMGYGASLSKIKGSSIEHAWASDYDKDSCNTYKRNIKTKSVFCEKGATPSLLYPTISNPPDRLSVESAK